jgi:hypothetical protein
LNEAPFIQVGSSYKTSKGIQAFVSYMVECDQDFRYVGHTVNDYGELTSVLWNIRGTPDPRYGDEYTLVSNHGSDRESKAFLVYSVYRNPKDFPGKYVIRAWDSKAAYAEGRAGNVFTVGSSLTEVREKLLRDKPYLVRTAPFGGDDPCIVEAWL